MVKVAFILAFAALAAPVFAAVINIQGVQSRELTSQAVFGRDVAEVEDLITRTPEEEDVAVFMRDDLDLETLEARSKIGDKIKRGFKRLWGGIKKVAKIFFREDEIEQRDDVAARDLDNDVEEVAREFDEPEMDAREFGNEEAFTREFDDEVYERDIEVDENLLERELGEELD